MRDQQSIYCHQSLKCSADETAAANMSPVSTVFCWWQNSRQQTVTSHCSVLLMVQQKPIDCHQSLQCSTDCRTATSILTPNTAMFHWWQEQPVDCHQSLHCSNDGRTATSRLTPIPDMFHLWQEQPLDCHQLLLCSTDDRTAANRLSPVTKVFYLWQKSSPYTVTSLHSVLLMAEQQPRVCHQS